jgi:hypothetical protein
VGPGQGEADFLCRGLKPVDVGIQKIRFAVVSSQQVEHADAAQDGQVIHRNDRLFRRYELTVNIIDCHNILLMVGGQMMPSSSFSDTPSTHEAQGITSTYG